MSMFFNQNNNLYFIEIKRKMCFSNLHSIFLLMLLLIVLTKTSFKLQTLFSKQKFMILKEKLK
jgi:hypothetical protein